LSHLSVGSHRVILGGMV